MKILPTLSVFTAAALLLTGCPKSAPSGDPATKELKLAFLTNNAATFWTIARKGCEQGAKTAGHVQVDFRIPSGGSAAEQQQIIDDLLAKGIDGLALSPVDPTNQTDILNKAASQALVITADSDAPASKRVCYIGTDNQQAGREAGKLLKEALPEGGKIMVFVGTLDAQNAKDRFAGIKEEIAGSKIEILDVRTDETDLVRAKNNVQDTLVKYPDIAGLVGLYSYNGPAIWSATKDAGKTGKVKIVCFDEDEQTLSGVAAGDIAGTVVQQPYEFGKQAIELMAKNLRGDQTVFPAAGRLVIPTLTIKKESVADFQAKMKALTNP